FQLITLFAYRFTLHPHAKYLGPFLAKSTTSYDTYHTYLGDIHLDINRLHT
ncbi:hypothetical protein BJ878DRAFT_425874, partial [Calycina marina]